MLNLVNCLGLAGLNELWLHWPEWILWGWTKAQIISLHSNPPNPLMQRVVMSSWKTEKRPVSCRESEECYTGPARVHEERFSQGFLYSIHWSCTLLQRCFSRMLFPLFVLKFWAAELTLGLFFSRDFEGSRQKGGLWSFSPKSSFLSTDMSLAEAQVSSHSELYNSNEINGMLWLEHWKTDLHNPIL